MPVYARSFQVLGRMLEFFLLSKQEQLVPAYDDQLSSIFVLSELLLMQTEEMQEHAHFEYLCSACGACRAADATLVSSCWSCIVLEHKAFDANAGFSTTVGSTLFLSRMHKSRVCFRMHYYACQDT